MEDEVKKPDTTLETLDAKLKTATEIMQKHAEALYKAAGEADKKENPSSEAPKAEETKDAEEGEVVN